MLLIDIPCWKTCTINVKEKKNIEKKYYLILRQGCRFIVVVGRLFLI